MKISIPKQEYEINSDDLNSIQEFIESIVPNFVKEFGGVLQDAVKGWRARNMIKIMVETKSLIEKSGLTPQELSGKFFVQAIEKASIEDDESLQSKWASLIANASLGKVNSDIKYVSILSELNSNEVKLLEAISIELLKGQTVVVEEIHGTHMKELVFSAQKSADFLNLSLLETQVIVDNFYRLNICQPPAMDGFSVDNKNALLRTNEFFTFTDLGRAFLTAVKN